MEEGLSLEKGSIFCPKLEINLGFGFAPLHPPRPSSSLLLRSVFCLCFFLFLDFFSSGGVKGHSSPLSKTQTRRRHPLQPQTSQFHMLRRDAATKAPRVVDDALTVRSNDDSALDPRSPLTCLRLCTNEAFD